MEEHTNCYSAQVERGFFRNKQVEFTGRCIQKNKQRAGRIPHLRPSASHIRDANDFYFCYKKGLKKSVLTGVVFIVVQLPFASASVLQPKAASVRFLPKLKRPGPLICLRVEFVLRTDSGYFKDTGVTSFTLATPGNPLSFFLSFLGSQDPTY